MCVCMCVCVCIVCVCMQCYMCIMYYALCVHVMSVLNEMVVLLFIVQLFNAPVEKLRSRTELAAEVTLQVEQQVRGRDILV